jgi:hypothetical protein
MRGEPEPAFSVRYPFTLTITLSNTVEPVENPRLQSIPHPISNEKKFPKSTILIPGRGRNRVKNHLEIDPNHCQNRMLN